MTRAAVAIALLGMTAGCQNSKAAATAAPRTDVPAESCGDKGKPDCPMQGWMKATLRAHLRKKDFGRLGSALDELARDAPEGYDGWHEMSLRAAAAAKAEDEEAVRAECKNCHDAHRAQFKRELRYRKLSSL